MTTDIIEGIWAVAQWPIAFLPLLLYLVLMLVTLDYQKTQQEDRRYKILKSREQTNLTLVAISFAIIGLIISVFKDDLNSIALVVYFLAAAMACFIVSYVLLWIKTHTFFDTFSAALKKNGIWCITLGVVVLTLTLPELFAASVVFLAALVILAGLIVVDIVLEARAFRKWRNGR